MQLLTATGARPEAWALCEQWMARQEYSGPVHWVIVDDGETPQPVTFSRDGWTLTVIRPLPRWKQGMNTQCRNMLAGLEKIDRTQPLLIIEDDDWYPADYLSVMSAALESNDLVGQKVCRKYSLINQRCKQTVENGRSSLCATGMKGHVIDEFESLCKKGLTLVDMALWGKIRGKLIESNRVVGMKGLPGRGGIDSGHKPTFGDTPDPSGKILREWVGDDAECYSAFRRNMTRRRYPDLPYGTVTQRHDAVLIVASGPTGAYFLSNSYPDCAVIAVNGAVTPRADYWFTQDLNFARKTLFRTPRSGRIASLQVQAMRMPWLNIPEDVLTLRSDYLCKGLTHDKSALSHGNSAFGALNLAVHFGAKKIGLIGVDGTTDRYWHGIGHSGHLKHLPQLFETAIPMLRDVEVRIAEGSRVTCFQQDSPENICRWLDN